jgi:hypothetical protein
MRSLIARSAVFSALGSVALLASAAGSMPAPPIKPGLWEVRMSVLDASGKPQAPPEQAAMANIPPEMRARMEEMMKARGLPMPGADGALKVCQTKESLDSGRWQALAASAGCTTSYTAQSASGWKFHSSCPKLKSESDGEVVFTNSETYSSKVTTTSNLTGSEKTQTRVAAGRWLGANCGDVKPFNPDSVGAQ